MPISHLRLDKLFHLCRTEASPFDLSGAKATHGPPRALDARHSVAGPSGIDGLSAIERTQRRSKRRNGHGISCLHRFRKRGAQAIPHDPSALIRRCHLLDVHRYDVTVDQNMSKTDLMGEASTALFTRCPRRQEHNRYAAYADTSAAAKNQCGRH
jgi:hypothetical protein